MTGPRVLFFIDSLGSGGAQRQMVLVFDALRRRGVDAWLTYVYPEHHFLQSIDARDQDRVTCLDGGGGVRKVRVLPRLRRHVAELAPDVLVSFLRAPSILVGMVRASGLRFRWLASERSTQLGQSGALRRTAYMAALRAADRVLPNSATMHDTLRAAGLPPERLGVVPNGIPLDPAALANPVERRHEPARLLMVGTMVPEKNQVTALRALAGMSEVGWTLDHLGRNDDVPALRAAFDTVVATHGLAPRVTLHGRQHDVARFYSKANLLVHPSLFEGFPNVVLEAWSWGCPVLVSDRDDLPRIVEHGRTGLVCGTDAESIREQVARALKEPDRLAELARAAREELVAKYGLDAVSTQWMHEITGRSRAEPR